MTLGSSDQRQLSLTITIASDTSPVRMAAGAETRDRTHAPKNKATSNSAIYRLLKNH